MVRARGFNMVRPLAIGLAAILGGCNPSAPPPDPYDQGKMDLKPAPAKVSAERHKGAFAEGASLSLSAELKPLDPAPVKTVRLRCAVPNSGRIRSRIQAV